ncbi:MAG: hypothetical protein GOVbin2014_29 [Prokaryotic dsDNA virus sp.]|jgi:hypothetical protein|nr:MAG: hypothetical protein GOVbin2014_29 [Prokaryotic dsDNA virus sp.]|tara:strand:- start:7179 stop:7670 length:492 start_codon:yes stop_codon:yes gene_type:complete
MSIDQNIGAQSYFKIVEKLRDALLNNKLINTVTVGDIGDIDLDKQTIYPLAHIVIGQANFGSTTINYEVSILIMDIVHNDLGIESEPSIYQNSSELYVLNSMLNVGNHIVDKLFVGDLYDGNVYINKENVTAEPFRDRFENVLAGWSFNFQLTTRNNIDRCNS